MFKKVNASSPESNQDKLHSHAEDFCCCIWNFDIKSLVSLLKTPFIKHGNNILVLQTVGFNYRLFSLLNFPPAAILDFMTSFLLCDNSSNRMTPKWQRARKLK